jgi:hypothetical protein
VRFTNVYIPKLNGVFVCQIIPCFITVFAFFLGGEGKRQLITFACAIPVFNFDHIELVRWPVVDMEKITLHNLMAISCRKFISLTIYSKEVILNKLMLHRLFYLQYNSLKLPFLMQNLIATKLGVQRITGITVFDTREKKSYDPLPDLEVGQQN